MVSSDLISIAPSAPSAAVSELCQPVSSRSWTASCTSIVIAVSSNLIIVAPCAPSAAGYELCQPRLIKVLDRLVQLREVPPDYTYYAIASPWAQCKALRALQYFPAPDSAGGLTD